MRMLQAAAGPDYNEYRMSMSQKLFCIATAASVILALSFVFYRSLIAGLFLCPLSLFYPKMKRKSIIKKNKEELNIQFKDMLYSVSSSVAAGRPVEQAFRELPADLEILYPDENAGICLEARIIAVRLDMNESIESALDDFSERSHLEDVRSFAEVFRTSKRSGGNIAEIIRNATNIINDRIEIGEEINTILAERKFEQKVLNFLPPLMMLLLTYSSGEYMEPVFTTGTGRIATTVAMLLFSAAVLISRKLADIKI